MVELEECYIVSKAHFVCHKVGPCGPSKRTGLVRGVLYTFFLWQEHQFREKPQQWAASTPPRLPCFAGCFWTGNSHIECQKGSLTWTYYTSYMLQKSCSFSLILLPGACVWKGFCFLETSSVRTEKCKQVRTPAHGDNSLVAASEHESNLQLKHSV